MSNLSVEPVTGALGAMVRGVDLSKKLSDSQISDIDDAFHQFLVLGFPDQNLSPATILQLTHQFGGPGETPYLTGLKDFPDVVPIIKEATERSPVTFGSGWHTDFTFQPQPPARTLLYAVDTPPVGGDTLYTNLYLAHDALSSGMRDMLGQLQGIHSAVRSYGPQSTMRNNLESMTITNAETEPETTCHPVLRTHPVTGRKALWVNPTYTIGIKDMTPQESAPILAYLNSLAISPSFTCRIKWQKGTLTMWDNRCTQHCATSDYHGHRREMLRTTTQGETPV